MHVHGLRIALPEAAVEIGADGLLVGCSADAHVVVDHAEVWPHVTCKVHMPSLAKDTWVGQSGHVSHIA